MPVPRPRRTGRRRWAGSWQLDGLATLADVWLNGAHLLHSDSMFATAASPSTPWPRTTSCASASPPSTRCWTSVARGHGGRPWAIEPEPPVDPDHAPRSSGGVGGGPPGRPVACPSASDRLPRSRSSGAAVAGHLCGPDRPDGTDGTVTVDLTVRGPALPADGPATVGHLAVGGAVGGPGASAVDGGVALVRVGRTAGVSSAGGRTPTAPRAGTRSVPVAGVTLDLGAVGFRTVVADRSDGGFRLVVNGVPVFCRGAGWYPIDPVSLQSWTTSSAPRSTWPCRAGINMLRIPGDTVYEDRAVLRHLRPSSGILVWQDAMLGPVDPPDDEEFARRWSAEVAELLDRAAPHPCLAVLCGGQEIEEQAGHVRPAPGPVADPAPPRGPARAGRPGWPPGSPTCRRSPSGGDLPFQTDAGVSHYFGVGVYLFPLDDLRRAAPRFVAEGLAFSMPPERATVDEAVRWRPVPAARAGVEAGRPPGRRFVVRPRGRPRPLRRATCSPTTWPSSGAPTTNGPSTSGGPPWPRSWRRPSPSGAGRAHRAPGCWPLALRDLRAGPGWGLVDSVGRPEGALVRRGREIAPRSPCSPPTRGSTAWRSTWSTTRPTPVEATLELGLHTAAHPSKQASRPVVVPARGGVEVRANGLLDGFRDLTYAYRFGPRATTWSPPSWSTPRAGC